MSLLFDALKRVQGNTDADSAKTILAATSRLPGVFHYARYAVPILALLAGGAGWYFYPKNEPGSTQLTMPVIEAASAVWPLASSQPAAASSVAQTGTTLAQAGGVEATANKGKPWTQPLGKKHSAKKRKPAPESAKLLASTGQDPLQEGYLALSEGRLDEAEQKYLAVLVQHPHEKDALLGLAVIAHRKMQLERAASLYRQVLREDLGNAAAAAGLVSLSSQADPVAAESQLKELIDIKPTAPEFHYALGGALARQLRWGEAQQAFFRAFKLEPGNALYAFNLAVSLDRLRQSAAALPYYEKAYQLAKQNDPTLDMDAITRRIQELSKVEPH